MENLQENVNNYNKRFYHFEYNYFTDNEMYFIISRFSKKDLQSYILLTYIVSNTSKKEDVLQFFSFAIRGNLSDVRLNTNLTTLNTLLLYEKDEYYYLVLKSNKDNRLNDHIATSFLISRNRHIYFSRNSTEEFNELGLTFVMEIKKI